jgi:hypothetical protein
MDNGAEDHRGLWAEAGDRGDALVEIERQYPALGTAIKEKR